MDIASLSTAMASMELGTKVSMAVMNLGKEQFEQMNEQMIEGLKEMELSVNPNVGSRIDIRG